MMPTKLTTKRMKSIVSQIEKGIPHNSAAAIEGIARSTLYNWLRNGARDVEQGRASTLHARFWVAVQQADANAFAEYLENTQKLADDEEAPAAARINFRMWWMEQRFRRHLGKPSEDMIADTEDEANIIERELDSFLDVLKAELDDESFERVLRCYAAGRAAPDRK